MDFKDNSIKAQGYFRIDSLNENGEIIDTFEKHNLITNTARIEFAKMLAGVVTNGAINRFVMGTKGHVQDDVLTPKNQDNGFGPSLTDLFSGHESQELNKTYSVINFTPSGSLMQTEATNINDGSNNNSSVNIQILGIEDSEPVLRYTFNVAQDAFNKVDNTGMIYTEAGLYHDDKLIAMRTFKGKVKDETTSFRITWEIIL